MKDYKNKIKFLVLIIGLSLTWYLGRFFHMDNEALQESLGKFPLFYAGITFVILYCVVTFFIWFSKDVFKFLGAVLFGPYLSTLFIWAAEISNAFILFYLARYLGRGFVENSLKEQKKNLDGRLSKFSFFWLFMFRLVPLMPFRFLDLAAGLSGISFKKYLIAVIFGSPLRIFWVQYILIGVGKSIFNNPYALLDYLLANRTLFTFSFFYVILTILITLRLKLK